MPQHRESWPHASGNKPYPVPQHSQAMPSSSPSRPQRYRTRRSPGRLDDQALHASASTTAQPMQPLPQMQPPEPPAQPAQHHFPPSRPDVPDPTNRSSEERLSPQMLHLVHEVIGGLVVFLADLGHADTPSMLSLCNAISLLLSLPGVDSAASAAYLSQHLALYTGIQPIGSPRRTMPMAELVDELADQASRRVDRLAESAVVASPVPPRRASVSSDGADESGQIGEGSRGARGSPELSLPIARRAQPPVSEERLGQQRRSESVQWQQQASATSPRQSPPPLSPHASHLASNASAADETSRSGFDDLPADLYDDDEDDMGDFPDAPMLSDEEQPISPRRASPQVDVPLPLDEQASTASQRDSPDDAPQSESSAIPLDDTPMSLGEQEPSPPSRRGSASDEAQSDAPVSSYDDAPVPSPAPSRPGSPSDDAQSETSLFPHGDAPMPSPAPSQRGSSSEDDASEQGESSGQGVEAGSSRHDPTPTTSPGRKVLINDAKHRVRYSQKLRAFKQPRDEHGRFIKRTS